MKKLLSLCLLILVLGVNAQDKNLYLYQVDPLDKILKDRSFFRDDVDTIAVARGETATIQLVLKANKELKGVNAEIDYINNETAVLTGHTGWIGYVRAGRKYSPPSKDLLRSASDFFPDPILTDTVLNLEQSDVQPLWVIVPIPLNAKPGIYKGQVTIRALVNRKKQQYTKNFYIRVYPVTVAKTSLLISNWSAHLNTVILSYLNHNKPVERYGELYWDLIKKHAEIMAAHRQNVYRIFPVWNTTFGYQNGKYSFDFTNFDKEVAIFEETGTLERIEGGHLAWRSGGWDDPYFVEVPVPDIEANKKLPKSPAPPDVINGMRLVKLPLEDPRAKEFLTQYLPALKVHLEQKGWLNKYMQHIGDEPVSKNAGSYVAISAYVKKYLPGVKIIDAVLTSKELRNGIDTWVPVLDVFHKDYKFYQELSAEGKEIWFYTCVGPRGNYANRFIELPLIQTRYLHWINYKYKATGYLHWGLNFWGGPNALQDDASRDGGKLPAGDNNIIYPGYHKLYSSIRFEAMRDGIYDYELLKMTEKKDPVKAKGFANTIVMNFDEYDGSITYFRKIRKQMLEFLSK
jgi:hypothetical protein